MSSSENPRRIAKEVTDSTRDDGLTKKQKIGLGIEKAEELLVQKSLLQNMKLSLAIPCKNMRYYGASTYWKN